MRCPDHHWLQDSMWRGYVLYSEHIERYRNLEKEIKEIEEKINSAIREELALKKFNNSNGYVFLQDLFSSSYPTNRKCGDGSFSNSNQTGYPMYIHQRKERKGHYIRLMPAGNEGNSVLIFVSALFGVLIIGMLSYNT